MNKVLDFAKKHILVIKWTIGYFFVLWLILEYIFRFNVFSYNHWWKFFHATLHGFNGFVFGALMYSAIPIYLAGVIITHKKQITLIEIPFAKKISEYIKKLLPAKPEATPDTEQDQEKSNEPSVPEYPSDMPPEMYVPFQRAKSRQKIKSESHENNLQLQPLMQTLDNQTNKPSTTIPVPEFQDTNKQNESDFPIPMDFDISDTINESDMVPQFKDLDFDTPIMTEPELTNETTKYLAAHNIEYETFRDFVATEKYVIYEHNDPDFWVIDENAWFAAGKQKDSPIPDLISLAKENDMTPVLYLAEQNIMDIDETIKKLESNGVRVIKSLSELD